MCKLSYTTQQVLTKLVFRWPYMQLLNQTSFKCHWVWCVKIGLNQMKSAYTPVEGAQLQAASVVIDVLRFS